MIREPEGGGGGELRLYLRSRLGKRVAERGGAVQRQENGDGSFPQCRFLRVETTESTCLSVDASARNSGRQYNNARGKIYP